VAFGWRALCLRAGEVRFPRATGVRRRCSGRLGQVFVQTRLYARVSLSSTGFYANAEDLLTTTRKVRATRFCHYANGAACFPRWWWNTLTGE